MEAPSLPEGLEEDLRGVREGLHLRWNPRSKVVRAGSFDVYGNVAEAPKYDGRWELWDRSPEGVEYKITTLEDDDGHYKPPGRWLVEFLHTINPANYDGNVSKMMTALVDNPNRSMLEASEKEFEDMVEQAALWVMWATTPKSRVTTNLS